MRCLGIASDGTRCDLDADHGSDDPYFCGYHDGQVVERVAGLPGSDGDEEPMIMVTAGDDTVMHAQTRSGARVEVETSVLSVGHPASDVDEVLSE